MIEDELSTRYKYERANESDIHFHITNACLDSCKYCYMGGISPYSPERVNMPLETFISIVETIRPKERRIIWNSNDRDVLLSGGDPLIHPNLSEIVTYLKNNDYFVSIMSSGLPLVKGDTEIWEIISMLDENDKVSINNNEIHSITDEQVNSIRQYYEEMNFVFSLEFNPLMPTDIVPTKRAMEYWSYFKFGENFLSYPGTYDHTNAVSPFPKNSSFNSCRQTDNFGQIITNPKGEFLYCVFQQDDPVCHIDDLKGMVRDDALHYIAEKIHKKRDKILDEYYSKYYGNHFNCFDHITGSILDDINPHDFVEEDIQV